MLTLHGWCGDRRFFAPQFDHFSATHRVVSVDLPGHGDSEPPSEYSIAALATEVAELANALDLTGSVVLGHSLGAMVALELTQRAPEVVGAVVMVDPPPLSKEVWKDFAAQLIPSFQGPSGPAGRRQFVEQMFLPTDDAERRGGSSMPCALSPTTPPSRWSRRWLPSTRSRSSELRVAGTRHRIGGSDHDRAFLLEANPTIVTGQTVGAGHFHQLEVADQVNSMIERFLAPSASETNRPAAN